MRVIVSSTASKIAPSSRSSTPTGGSRSTPMRSGPGSSTQAATKAPSCGGGKYASPGSEPAMTSSISAQSATVRAMGPLVAKPSQASYVAGAPLTSPRVGLWPTTPQQAAGMRIEPPPSEPWAIVPMPAASAAAAPPLEPPGVRVSSRGLRVMPKSRFSVVGRAPISGVLVLPIRTAPARRRRATQAASAAGTLSANAREP